MTEKPKFDDVILETTLNQVKLMLADEVRVEVFALFPEPTEEEKARYAELARHRNVWHRRARRWVWEHWPTVHFGECDHRGCY